MSIKDVIKDTAKYDEAGARYALLKKVHIIAFDPATGKIWQWNRDCRRINPDLAEKYNLKCADINTYINYFNNKNN